MKPLPKHDFPISVRKQEWEEDSHVAHLFEGIYTILLNHQVTIVFVPDVSSTAPPWDIELPEYIEYVNNSLEARIYTILLSQYSVTPNSELKDQERLVPLLFKDSEEFGLVYFVSPDLFARLDMELAELSKELGSIHSERTVSDLLDFTVVQLLLTRILESPNLAPETLRVLGR